jgi:hypothetical protein
MGKDACISGTRSVVDPLSAFALINQMTTVADTIENLTVVVIFSFVKPKPN